MPTWVQNSIKAQIGDKVEMTTDSRRFHQALLTLYGIPPVFLLVGGLIGQGLGERWSDDPNLWSILTGCFLFVLSMVLIRRITSRFDERLYRPQIVRVVKR